MNRTTPAPRVGPWTAILLPALLDTAPVPVATPRGDVEKARHDVIRARAAAAAGDAGTCDRLLKRALPTGRTEVASLAIHLLPDGPLLGLQRMSLLLPRGEVADLAADLAARLLIDDQVDAVQVVIRKGLNTCPDHGELGRWKRFLMQTPPAVAVAAARLHRAGQEISPEALSSVTTSSPIAWNRLQGDVASLIPRADTGWMPPERINRKLLPGVLDAQAPMGTGLRRVQDAGCTQRRLATDDELMVVSPLQEIVDLEIIADRAESLLDEERPASATLQYLWERLREAPDAVTERGTVFLASLAVAHPTALPTALHGVAWMMRRPCFRRRKGVPMGRLDYWRALKARLLLESGRREEARCLARSLVASEHAQPQGWSLAMETLDEAGDHAPVHEMALRRWDHPVLGPVARQYGPDETVVLQKTA